jgi:acyl-CoA reductase-like NAD-dependent aldehyde dehydrogenase
VRSPHGRGDPLGERHAFGLNAAAFTNDLRLAWHFGESLEHGTVMINETTNYWDQLAAFGGRKQSGARDPPVRSLCRRHAVVSAALFRCRR